MEENVSGGYDEAKMAIIQTRMKLESQLKSGANWFYAIAVLSLVNSLIFLFNGGLNFVVGLGITQVIDGIMWAISEELGADGAALVRTIGLGINMVIIGVFALFGYLGRKQQRWVFIVGMVLYGLDVLILIWAQDVFSILFHAIALFGLFRGLKAIGDIKTLESKLRAPAEPVAWQ